MIWLKYLKYVGLGVLIAVIMAIGFKLGSRSRDNEMQELAVRLAANEKTIEIEKGLYATAIVELKHAEGLLDGSRSEVKLLKEQLKKAGAELLTSQQLTIRWKKAYEAALAANQTEEPNPNPGDPVRKRIDFTGTLGPILATGHTITDPPEAYLKLEQIIPLILTVAVAQNKDGTWTSYVTSSDDNIDVQVSLAGVSPRILSQKWYQRIWLDLGAAALGDPGVSVGLSYRGNRYSIGATCLSTGDSSGCGATLGLRIFK